MLIGLVELAERHGISRDQLLTGFRHSPEHLMDAHNRTDWDIAVKILLRVRAAAGSREAFLDIAKAFGTTPAYNQLHQFASAVFDPIHFFTFPQRVVMRIRDGAHQSWDWKIVGPRLVEGRLSTDEAHPAPVELWEFDGVCFSKLPGLIGLPDAEVELLDWSAHHARYMICVPPSGTLWARARRFLRLDRTPHAFSAESLTQFASSQTTFSDKPDRENTTPQNEVSCRVILGFAEMSEAYGIAREKILSGFRHSPEHLTDPHCRTDWEICIGVLDRMWRETGSREKFAELAGNYAQTPSYAFMRTFVSGILSPLHFFTYPQHIFLQQVLGRFINWRWQRQNAKTIVGILSTDTMHPAPLPFWDMCGVVMSKLPGFIGLSDAVVRVATHDAHHAEYHIILPPSGTWLARCTRFFRIRAISPDPLFEFFAREHEDLRRSYEVLNATETERSALARDLLRVADKEREHFAREIHDGLGQELVAVKYQLEALARQLDGPAGMKAGQLAEIVTKTNQLARTLARTYDPLVGSGGGFETAVSQLAAQYEGQLRFEMHDLEILPFTGGRSLHLYRITQEAVTNALRHGNATFVRISAQHFPGRFELWIDDNGKGLPKDHTPGMGLRTMRYRLGEVGGKLELEPSPFGGLGIRCLLPTASPTEQEVS